jgi:tetratricopeptide (TPR) repeat protein
VSPRVRVYVIVAVCAVASAGAVVGITAATHHSPPEPLGPRTGNPPFASDETAPPSLIHDVRAALQMWPRGTIPRLRGLAEAQPRSGFVRVNLGLALFWMRQDAAAAAQWRAATRIDPDTPSAIRAGDLLHPNSPPGLPFFVAGERIDPRARPELLRGIALQRAGRPVSAERAFAAAVRRAPDDVQTLVAAAVSRFTKEHPERAFSRLGPLAARFPHNQAVRFHLGLLSIWIGDFGEARRQLELARTAAPTTRLGREAKTLLASLVRVGTG